MSNSPPKIGKSILIALRDCHSFRRGTYTWKRATMAKAVALGLAEEIPHKLFHGQKAFALTQQGLDALPGSEG